MHQPGSIAMKPKVHASKSKVHALRTRLILLLTFFLGGTVYAQENQLQIIFESPQSTRLARFNSVEIDVTASLSDLHDFNGDGIDDLTMTRENDQGGLQDLLVLQGGAGLDIVIYEVQNVPETLGLGDEVEFYGFANFFGGDVRHGIYVGNLGVSLVDPSNNTVAWSSGDFNGDIHTLLDVIEVTGDGFADLLILSGISMPTLQRVQVWSSAQ